jgi:type I restriction enzyme M protein
MDQELEKTLWATADKLRNNRNAAEYKLKNLLTHS